MPKDTLSVTDNRTGQHYEIPITYGTYPTYGAAVRAADLREIKASDEDFGLLAYDPGYGATGACQSQITFIDGEKGILRHCGYPIEELAEHCTYLEVAYLLIHGELPDQGRLGEWTRTITHHTMVNESVRKLMDGFRYGAHPMGMLVSTVAALSTLYPEAKAIDDPGTRRDQIHRLIGKVPTIAAYAYRHRQGLPFVYPDNELSYTGNFLSMMFKMAEPHYQLHPVLERMMEVLFILHADHEQNCSTSTMRMVGSSHSDPYMAAASATAALYGPLHGGANEQVLRMLNEIGSSDRVPEYIERVKAREVLLMGFGHRVYKNYDPRARILKDLAGQVFEVTGSNPLLDIALELERIALEDEYFVSRNLYPNVDFYTGIIYQAMGFPVEMFPVLFAVARMSGWLSQWEEMMEDPELRIARPRQVYTGEDQRSVVPLDDRG